MIVYVISTTTLLELLLIIFLWVRSENKAQAHGLRITQLEKDMNWLKRELDLIPGDPARSIHH